MSQIVTRSSHLTYMSTKTHIAQLEADGKLVRYVPHSRHPLKRCLFLTSDASDDLTNPESAINLLHLRPQILAAMTHRVTGGLVYAAKGKGRFMRLLEAPPTEVWELRITDPRVQSRAFCRFPEPDAIVMTKIHTRQLLGKKKSPEWARAMKACCTVWDGLFPHNPPFTGFTVHDYITENCHDFPL